MQLLKYFQQELYIILLNTKCYLFTVMFSVGFSSTTPRTDELHSYGTKVRRNMQHFTIEICIGLVTYVLIKLV
jgi:hypothetical protein